MAIVSKGHTPEDFIEPLLTLEEAMHALQVAPDQATLDTAASAASPEPQLPVAGSDDDDDDRAATVTQLRSLRQVLRDTPPPPAAAEALGTRTLWLNARDRQMWKQVRRARRARRGDALHALRASEPPRAHHTSPSCRHFALPPQYQWWGWRF